MSKLEEGIEQRLSPEELAALNDEGSDDTAALDNLIDDDAGNDDGADDKGGEGNDAGADDAAAGDGAAAAVVEGAGGDDTTVDDDTAAEFQPQIHVEPVENYDERMRALADQKAALRKQLTDGDIDIEQYEAQKDGIVDQETELRLQQRDYENAIVQRKKEGEQKWQWEQEQFFEREENALYNAKDLRATAMHAALNQKVIELANDPANAKRSGTWFLTEADRQVREAMGMTSAPKPKPRREPDLTNLPKTLGTLPAAENTETGSDEFGYLDKLEGVELEQALAAISRDPVKEQRYLRR